MGGLERGMVGRPEPVLSLPEHQAVGQAHPIKYQSSQISRGPQGEKSGDYLLPEGSNFRT